MSENAFSLWGFDGELDGNQHRFQYRLPLFTRDGDAEHVYVARVLDWSEGLPAEEVRRVPLEQAARYGEELRTELEKPIVIPSRPVRFGLPRPMLRVQLGDVRVRPGQYVAIAGREFVANVRAIGLITMFGVRTVKGAYLQMMDQKPVDGLTSRLEAAARQRFDREIGGLTATPAVHAALAVMRGTGTGELRNHLLRMLAVHRLEADSDQYRRTLRLASVRLKDSENRLEEDLDRFFRMVQSIAAVQQQLGLSLTFSVVGGKSRRFFVYPGGTRSAAGNNVIVNPKSFSYRTKAETGALDVIVKPEQILGE